MHHGKVHPHKVTTELIWNNMYCVCDWLLNGIKGIKKKKKKKKKKNSSRHTQCTGLFCKPTKEASHTQKVLGGVCVCLFACQCVCACLDTIKTSSWRRVPMHHPDDSGQAVCFAAADIELNDVVLHCGCRGWPAHHWCVAAGFQLGVGVCVCVCVCERVCVFRQIKPLVGCRGVKMPAGIFCKRAARNRSWCVWQAELQEATKQDATTDTKTIRYCKGVVRVSVWRKTSRSFSVISADLNESLLSDKPHIKI